MKKLLVVVIVLAVIAAAIIYVPRYIVGSGNNVGVKFTDADLKSAMDKLSIKDTTAGNIDLFSLSQGKFTGKKSVDTSLTDQEFSALASNSNEKNGPIKDVEVKFLSGGQAETSFKFTDKALDFIKTNDVFKTLNIPGLAVSPLNRSLIALKDFLGSYISSLTNNASVYAKGSVVKDSKNSVIVRIDSLKIGQITMSAGICRKVEQGVKDFVNAIITANNGFSIDEIRVEDGKFFYKGTLPDEVTPK